MKVFFEKEFIENFEIEFSDKKYSEPFKLLYTVFTQYPNIECYTDIEEDLQKEAIEGSEILTKLTDINPRIKHVTDFKVEILKKSSFQTLVFTAQEKDWFEELKELPVLFFSYKRLEEKLSDFIEKNHKKFDLSDEESRFDWKYFDFLYSDCEILLISDSYIISDKYQQKIKDNLLLLLNKNLNPNKFYKIFIITELSDSNVREKITYLNSELAKFRLKIYLINRIKQIEVFDLHDRLLYTNYTVTTSPAGFNIKSRKLSNSEVITTSIFDEYTYKKQINHIKGIKKYLTNLEMHSQIGSIIKVIPKKSFKEFHNINFD